MSQRFDVVVLGAGPGGYIAAVRAAQLGRTVAVVEPRYWGGVCLNVGCVPAKTLLRNAEIADLLANEKDLFGISGDATLDYGAAFRRSRTVAEGRTKGVHFLMKKNGIVEFDGTGVFRDGASIEVALSGGGTEVLEFGDAIVATGAVPKIPAGMSLGPRVVDYEGLILRDAVPASIVIVGGGAIGVEFAYLLRAFGVEVTVVEFLDRLLPNEDDDVSAELAKRYAKSGIRVLTGTRVDGIDETADAVAVRVAGANGAQTLTAELALVAIGFAPRSAGLGLEAIGAEIDDRGAIVIDDQMRTTAPHVFAIGDVTAKLQLAHVAETQGVVAAETIAGVETLPIQDYRMMPRATFCRPQVASFGLTERQARDEGHDIRVSTFPFVANAKAHALGDPGGFIKLIADAEHGLLLGAHLIGPDVSELLPQLTLAQAFELTAEEIARNVHTHPTLSEVMLEAAHGIVGAPLNL